jgi:uncharacterized protein
VTHELVAALLGLAAGVLSALFGVGGGIVFVPTLIFLGDSAHVAVATSLAAMVPVIVMGAWRQTRYGAVRWRAAIVIGLASVPTAKLGEVAATSLSNAALRRAFAVLLLGTTIQLAWRTLRRPGEPEPEPEPERKEPADARA